MKRRHNKRRDKTSQLAGVKEKHPNRKSGGGCAEKRPESRSVIRVENKTSENKVGGAVRIKVKT